MWTLTLSSSESHFQHVCPAVHTIARENFQVGAPGGHIWFASVRTALCRKSLSLRVSLCKAHLPDRERCGRKFFVNGKAMCSSNTVSCRLSLNILNADFESEGLRLFEQLAAVFEFCGSSPNNLHNLITESHCRISTIKITICCVTVFQKGRVWDVILNCVWPHNSLRPVTGHFGFRCTASK